VSENDHSHCAGTTKVEVTSCGKENRHSGCGRDVLRQTVPGANGGNRKGPIADGRQPCATDGQSARQEVERSRLRYPYTIYSDSFMVDLSTTFL